MDGNDSDCDISWLTQVPSLEQNGPNFSLGEDYFDGNMNEEGEQSVVISLEESNGRRDGRVLYDNVVCEDISSDEEVDKM